MAAEFNPQTLLEAARRFGRLNLPPVELCIAREPDGVVRVQKVFDQIVRYNMVLRVPWLMVSNGLRHYCCRVDYDGRRVAFLPDIPPFTSLQS